MGINLRLNDVPSNVYADAGNIFREVPTEKGKVYKLSFDASGRPGYDASVNSLKYLAGGKQLGFYNYDMTERKIMIGSKLCGIYRDSRKMRSHLLKLPTTIMIMEGEFPLII